MESNDIHLRTNQTCRANPRHLVGYGVGARCGARDVVESVGHGGILHDVTSMNDIGACGRDLHLNLITDAGDLGEQAHPGQQLGDFLCWLTVRRRQSKRRSWKRMMYNVSEDIFTAKSNLFLKLHGYCTTVSAPIQTGKSLWKLNWVHLYYPTRTSHIFLLYILLSLSYREGPNDLLDANFSVDELARQLLLPVSQLLKHKPGDKSREKLGDSTRSLLHLNTF